MGNGSLLFVEPPKKSLSREYSNRRGQKRTMRFSEASWDFSKGGNPLINTINHFIKIQRVEEAWMGRGKEEKRMLHKNKRRKGPRNPLNLVAPPGIVFFSGVSGKKGPTGSVLFLTQLFTDFI